MVLRVIGERVSVLGDPPHDRWERLGVAADEKEGRLDAFVAQYFEHATCHRRHRAVVEGQHDLPRLERQSAGILHRADTGEPSWINFERAQRAERVGVQAVFGDRRSRACEAGCERSPLQEMLHPVSPRTGYIRPAQA